MTPHPLEAARLLGIDTAAVQADRLAHAQAHFGRPLTRAERFHEVFLASKESRRALLFGQLLDRRIQIRAQFAAQRHRRDGRTTAAFPPESR